MATSSSILQSFLRDAFKENKNLADLSYEELLNYNRAECGLIELDFNPNEDFEQLNFLVQGNDSIILYDDELYFIDIKGQKVQKLLVPTDQKKLNYYNRLKESCSLNYKRAEGLELKWIRSLTDRAFAEYRSNDFLFSLDFYLSILNDTDRVMFRYMNDKQRKELTFNLRITLLLLAAQQKHEKEYQKVENSKKYDEYIIKCSDYLRELDPEYQKLIEKFPDARPSDARPMKYMGIPIGQLIARDIVDLGGGITKKIREGMDNTNYWRLYWVWGSSFLKTVIDLIPEQSFASNDAAKMAGSTISFPDTFTGSLSWALYYARFFMNLGLLLKHTIKHPWMSDEEAKTPWQDRFLTQWDQRKFTLLNDSIWGTANLACFFWLTGKGALGAAGDAVTLALLVFDIVISLWDFEEQRTKYNKAMLQYEEDIERLKNQLEMFRGRKLNDDELFQKNQIKIQIRALERQKSKCDREWQLQKVSLINNIAYAVGLMLAFVLLTMPFMPVAAPILATMAIVGAVLCLAFTIINNAMKGGIELYKTYKTMQEQKEDYVLKVKELTKLLKKEHSDLNDNERKLIFLEIKKYQAETEYQRQTMIYQSANLVRSIMLESLIPAIILINLILVPAGVGVATLIFAAALILALALASQMIVDNLFKQEDKKELEFDQLEYDQFCEVALENEDTPEKTLSFFKNGSCGEGRIVLKRNEDDSFDYDEPLLDIASNR